MSWTDAVTTFAARPRAALVVSLAFIGAIAAADYVAEANVSLGFLYLLPILIAGLALDRVSVLLLAI
ncbi:MAG TPA: hypothetical protein VFL57_18590, partial [Bryobacteraceae bacterium]|nr:hypothetical protein [Bryobacteraceae bacterium]